MFIKFQAWAQQSLTYFSALDSPHYNKKSSKPFFEQMFVQESRLGAGSFGEVFKVRSKDDGKTYAVKKAMFQYKGVGDR